MIRTNRHFLFRFLTMSLLLALVLIAGCKSSGKSKDDHMPAGGHAEELKDSTRLDAAQVDTFQESAKRPVDSTIKTSDTTTPH